MSKFFDAWRKSLPDYDEPHEELAMSLRRFVDKEVAPHIETWEKVRIVPKEFQKKATDAGILGMGWPEELGGYSEGIDIFHLERHDDVRADVEYTGKDAPPAVEPPQIRPSVSTIGPSRRRLHAPTA